MEGGREENDMGYKEREVEGKEGRVGKKGKRKGEAMTRI